MTLTMNELLSPGFITAYILGFIFLILVTRFQYDSCCNNTRNCFLLL